MHKLMMTILLVHSFCAFFRNIHWICVCILDKLTIILTWMLLIGTRKIHVFLYLIISNYLHWGHSCIHAFNNRKIYLEQPYARNPRVCWWKLPYDMFAYMFSCFPGLPTFYSIGNFSHMQWLYCGLEVIKTPLWHLKHIKLILIRVWKK